MPRFTKSAQEPLDNWNLQFYAFADLRDTNLARADVINPCESGRFYASNQPGHRAAKPNNRGHQPLRIGAVLCTYVQIERIYF